ncbi:MAG: hypothetical protein ACYCYM_04710 [Saccharofermentanales bacterium]
MSQLISSTEIVQSEFDKRSNILIVESSSSKISEETLKSTTSSRNASSAIEDTFTDLGYNTYNMMATDVYGRMFPEITGYRKDRYVGLFYFMWLGQYGEQQYDIYDMTKLLANNPEALWDPSGPAESPNMLYHFWGEPLYGYYNSADEWVIRKHIELLVTAGVDFLALDVTNGLTYDAVWPKLFELLDEYQKKGWNVPKIAFFTKTSGTSVVQKLYSDVYKSDFYPNLWFRPDGDKPLIIAETEGLSSEIQEFFYFKSPQWSNEPAKTNGFPYCDWERPQHLYENIMSVSIAQHTAGAFSFSGNPGIASNRGKGYTDAASNTIPENIRKGANFQEQWEYAIKTDPEIVFVTGWNEWVALKLECAEINFGTPFFVDTLNEEYSRDIEMANGAYGDNFYLQLVQNIRKYKGIAGSLPNPVSKSIDVKGDSSQWSSISNIYRDIATQKIERSAPGFVYSLVYTQPKPKNIIQEIRVTHDDNNLYFYVRTKDNISKPTGKTNWMNLFIGINGSSAASWNNFQYVINRYQNSNGTISLEQSNGGFNFSKVADLKYSVQGKIMQISVPKNTLGITGDSFSINFKLADGVNKPEDIMDYYVSGDCVPQGRMAYLYKSN